ncbi:MAG: hypothetical protein K2X62_04495 [Beijerinckiaceae bacterium]|jgi:hypothetical protein|nr:hypothetical protein [Beijerinckiaceae bacterium]MDO9440037.1 hypothetical protein [Beijerinckiaceae bacterium]
MSQATTEVAKVCRSECEETCKAEGAQQGCNPAMGLTSCRIRQDRCVATCERKCPKR